MRDPGGTATPDVRFGVLGSLEVTVDGRQVVINAAKQRVLLAALLLRANRVVGFEELIARLWDTAPGRARGSLHTHVARLRQVLGVPNLRTEQTGYLVAVPPGALDLHRFDELVARADRTGDTDAAELARLLHEALALWRGEPLADVASEKLRREDVPQLAGRRLAVLRRRIAADLLLGRHEGLVAELRALVAEHPLDEEFAGQLVLALYRSARQAEALDAFHAARDRLHLELGVEPGEPLRTLHQRILAGDPDLRPLPAVSRAPSLLPLAIPDYVGRTRELDQIHERLAGGVGRAPVVVVAGPPGVGKTALAVRVGHRSRAEFPHGQLYADLRGFSSEPAQTPVRVLTRFLRALDVPVAQVPSGESELVERYQVALAGRRVLVVLDNATEAQLSALLPVEPGCAALVTSRTELRPGADAELVVLDTLDDAEAHDLITTMLGETVTGENPAATADLITLCGHLPLALRIAAANVAGRPTGAIADYVRELRSADRLDALAVHGDPQAAVRLAFDASYAVLPTEARRAFRLLALLPGEDFTVLTAGAALAADAAEPLVTLAGANLVAQHEPGRYRLHDLLRIYAAERAEAEEPAAERDCARGRVYACYLAGADGAAKVLYPDIRRLPLPPPPTGLAVPEFAARDTAVAWLDAERGTLAAVVRSAAEHGAGRFSYLLTDTLRGYFNFGRHRDLWQASTDIGLAAARADADLDAEASMVNSIGTMHWTSGEYPQAAERYREAQECYRAAGDLIGQAISSNNLGIVAWEQGDLERTVTEFDAALAHYRAAGDTHFGTGTLSNLGMVHGELAQLDAARERLIEALGLLRERGFGHHQASCLDNLGQVLHELGDLAGARERLRSALAMHRELGSRSGEVNTLSGLGGVLLDLGELPEAVGLAVDALELARDTGYPRNEVDASLWLAAIRLRERRPAEAAELSERALSLGGELGYRRGRLLAMVRLAEALRVLGELPEARRHLRTALELVHTTQHRLREAAALRVLAAVLLDLGDRQGALDTARRSLLVSRTSGQRPEQVRALLVLAAADRARAPDYRAEANALAAGMGMVR